MDEDVTAEVSVVLDGTLFTDDDRQALEERLETRFRVESDLVAYTRTSRLLASFLQRKYSSSCLTTFFH